MTRKTKRIRGPNGDRATRIRRGGGFSVERRGKAIVIEGWGGNRRMRWQMTSGEALCVGSDLVDAAELTAAAWREP
jgi:hypothetical protein